MPLSKSICLLYFLSISCFIGCGAQENIFQQVNLLAQKERNDDYELFEKFKKYGKNAIPYLIEVIDKDEKGFVGFGDPASSKYFPFHFNYVGLRAAYMIEFIIADTNTIKIFEYGVIVKREDSQIKSLSVEDIKEIKKIYKKWWERNKLKSLNELNKEWKNNNQILAGSSYVWQ